jgi:hypothetical protein
MFLSSLPSIGNAFIAQTKKERRKIPERFGWVQDGEVHFSLATVLVYLFKINLPAFVIWSR